MYDLIVFQDHSVLHYVSTKGLDLRILFKTCAMLLTISSLTFFGNLKKSSWSKVTIH